MAKSINGASDGRSTAKAITSRASMSKSVASKTASKAPVQRVSKSVTRSMRTGRTSHVRDAASQLRVDTFGPVDSIEIHRLDQLVTDAEEISVLGKGNRRVPVTGALLKALGTVVGALARGSTVTVTEADQLDTELTSQEAADLLNVSRPYVVKLAREGVLPHRRVGNRHRFTLVDVLEHRSRMRATAEEALAELAPADGYTTADF
ncbi:MAG: excisionase family DNA-binding protein [Austwickia sp.]|nr:excisionase family DNA-binding protein [Austwickia sp.]MBK8437188.1 excisionase family DNA-binding protein [Austwickia sp.]MBK9102419.1 excisionase family DNA-binding protein [Austwickia sp.]